MNCGLGAVAAMLRFKPGLIHHQQKMEMERNWMRPMLLGLLLCLSSGANAASAIVYDDDGRYGYAMNHGTLSAAMQRALQHCAVRSRNCAQTSTTTAVGYSAIAVGTVAMGFALAEKTADAAQRRAERMCRQRADDCTLAILWRETPGDIALSAHPGHRVPEPRLYSLPEVGKATPSSTD